MASTFELQETARMLRCVVCRENIACEAPVDYHAHVSSCQSAPTQSVGTPVATSSGTAAAAGASSLFHWRMPRLSAVAAYLPERFTCQQLPAVPKCSAVSHGGAHASLSTASGRRLRVAADPRADSDDTALRGPPADEPWSDFATFPADEVARLASMTPAHVLGNVRGGFCYALNDTDADVVADLGPPRSGFKLFLGSEAAARSPRFLTANRISIILNSAANSVPLPIEVLRACGITPVRYHRVSMDDRRDESHRSQLEAAALWLHQQVVALEELASAESAVDSEYVAHQRAGPGPASSSVVDMMRLGGGAGIHGQGGVACDLKDGEESRMPVESDSESRSESAAQSEAGLLLQVTKPQALASRPQAVANGIGSAVGGSGAATVAASEYSGHHHDGISGSCSESSARAVRAHDVHHGGGLRLLGLAEKEPGNVLVHCVGGMSRSTAVILTYLVKHRGGMRRCR